MIASYLARASLAADRAKRLLVFGMIGGSLILVGAAFLVAALWIVLAHAVGHAGAGAILGSVFVVIGILIAVIGTRPRYMAPPPPVAPPHRRPSRAARLADAFLLGLEAARALRRR